MAEKHSKPARGLGRGLSALLGEDQLADDAQAAARDTRKVAIEHLHRGRFQPRRHFDPAEMEALTESVRAQGILSPLLVRVHPDLPGEFEIVAGERRWRAAQAAKLAEVPVLLRDLTNTQAMEIALVENVQRADLNPVEEADGYRRLMDEFHHTQEDLARVTGKSRPHIANLLRLLSLPAEVKSLIEQGQISMGHARALIGHADAVTLAKAVVEGGLSVRQTEALAKHAAQTPAARKGAAAAPTKNADIRALERELEILLGVKARITDEGGAGSLTLSYKKLDQLDEILRRLRGAG